MSKLQVMTIEKTRNLAGVDAEALCAKHPDEYKMIYDAIFQSIHAGRRRAMIAVPFVQLAIVEQLLKELGFTSERHVVKDNKQCVLWEW